MEMLLSKYVAAAASLCIRYAAICGWEISAQASGVLVNLWHSVAPSARDSAQFAHCHALARQSNCSNSANRQQLEISLQIRQAGIQFATTKYGT
jgi:hypothetical protein